MRKHLTLAAIAAAQLALTVGFVLLDFRAAVEQFFTHGEPSLIDHAVGVTADVLASPLLTGFQSQAESWPVWRTLLLAVQNALLWAVAITWLLRRRSKRLGRAKTPPELAAFS